MINEQPIMKEINANASHLYFIFGGIGLNIAMPPFEFYNSSKIISENKIFIRDVYQCWYHNGLPGISSDIYSTVEYITKEIETYHPKKVYFVGFSMGGYASLLYASMIGYGEAIAFSPQTFLSPFLKMKYFDNRYKKQILNTYKYSLFKRKVWDLKPILMKNKSKAKMSIFVGRDHRLDYIHADRLRVIPNIKIFEFESTRHDIVKTLRDDGKLPAIMTGNYDG